MNTVAILTHFKNPKKGCEVGFPQHLVLDRETSFMKIVNEAEINLQDLQLKSFKEYGIKCTMSPVAAHNFYGLVE